MTRSTSLTIGTTITREDAYGDPVEADVCITFAVEDYHPAVPAQLYGPPERCYPGEAAEFSATIETIEFDGEPPDAISGPLTDTERATVTAWFGAHQDEVSERVEEHMADADDGRADYLYDRWKDEQMERAHERGR